jgi:F0F1-type ATP synthase assembly protein I
LNPKADFEQSRLWRHVFSGTTFAVTILLCLYIGVQVDKHWPTSPWGVVGGVFFGFGVGFFNLIREFNRDLKN